jgi:hypothetical protein
MSQYLVLVQRLEKFRIFEPLKLPGLCGNTRYLTVAFSISSGCYGIRKVTKEYRRAS